MERLRNSRTTSLWLVPLLALLCSAQILAAMSPAPQQTVTLENATVLENLGSMPLAFTQNTGQWPDSISFRANAGGTTMWFTPSGAYYQFTRRIPSADNSAIGSDVMANKMHGPGHEQDSLETMLIKASFVGCNPDAKLAGSEQLAYTCNYFLGNDQAKWRTDVPNYTSVTYTDVYHGINLKYYGDGSKMEYDFIVPPGADYAQIQIQYDGAKSLTVNATGDLVIETAWGKVTEHAPRVYQTDGAKRTTISSAYRIAGDHTFGFTLGKEYNRELAVVIDPVLTYSTYLGGGNDDRAYAIAVDSAGSAYVTGQTTSSDFPTVNPFDGSYNGNTDAFVTKLSPTGNSLGYSTYLGGSSYEVVLGITVDGTGSAYVTGQTNSSDFPTVNPFDGSYNGNTDAFVTKLSPTGNSLVYSTFLGGSGDNEGGISIAVDSAGNAYVTGQTGSTNFPTVNPFDGSRGGNTDAFVTKLSPAGNSLVYSTYLGGGSSDGDYSSIAVDLAGSAYVTGNTASTDFPTVNPFDGSLNGSFDAFVTKLSPAGNSLGYSTYLGGSYDEFGFGIAVDGSGSAYVTGQTGSTNFPTQNPYDGSYNSAPPTYYIDAFVTKLSPAGNSLVYSTYLGGTGIDQGFSIAVDSAGSAYVTGNTASTDFPTQNPYDGSYNGAPTINYGDAYVTILSPGGNSLVYSTFLGGNSNDAAYGITVDGAGGTYVTGYTSSTDFPIATPFDGSYNGAKDVFVVKVTTPSTACKGLTGNVDCDENDRIDISDLTALVDYLYISFTPLCNTKEANVDGSDDGRIDISDLTALVDYLYISFTPPAPCR